MTSHNWVVFFLDIIQHRWHILFIDEYVLLKASVIDRPVVGVWPFLGGGGHQAQHVEFDHMNGHGGRGSASGEHSVAGKTAAADGPFAGSTNTLYFFSPPTTAQLQRSAGLKTVSVAPFFRLTG